MTLARKVQKMPTRRGKGNITRRCRRVLMIADCTDIRTANRYHRIGIRVIGLSASRPHLSAYFVSGASVFYDSSTRSLYILRFVTRTPAVFAPGTARKIARAHSAAALFESIRDAREPTRRAIFVTFPLSSRRESDISKSRVIYNQRESSIVYM